MKERKIRKLRQRTRIEGISNQRGKLSSKKCLYLDVLLRTGGN
jgi:hypothetical protein